MGDVAGVIVGAPPPRRTPGVSVDFSGMNPYLNALMSRWNQVMDIQTKRLSAQPHRDELAFQEWEESKDLNQEQQRVATDIAYQQEKAREEEALRARKGAENAAYRADMERRAALNASVGRAQALQTQYGGPTPFNPSGALADYYEYGAGAGGRKGGGDVASGRVSDEDTTSLDAMRQRQCLANPATPGCPELLTKLMAQGKY